MTWLARAAIMGDRVMRPGTYGFFPVWENLSVPHRPTPRECAHYRAWLGRARELLMLGATPELRDLAAEQGLRPVLVDRSEEMLSRMLRLSTRAQARDERWIQDDWLEARLPERSFEVVWGDLSLRHIERQRLVPLLAKIARLLVPGGKFVVRHHVVNPRCRTLSYEELLREFECYPYAEKKYEAMGILLSRLFDRSTKAGVTDRDEIAREVARHLERGISFSYGLFLEEFMHKLVRALRRPLLSQTAEEAKEVFSRFFRIRGMATDGTYPESSWYRIYMLEPLP